MKQACAANLRENLAAACEVCTRNQQEPSPWVHHIAWLALLKKGGYPFDKNDLSIDEWISLGEYYDELEMLVREQKAETVHDK